MGTIKERNIGEAKLSADPKLKIGLKLGDKVVKENNLADKSVSVNKLADDVALAIEGVEQAGLLVSQELGDSEVIGISQKKITEEVESIQESLQTTEEGLSAVISGKQDKLTFDTTPTDNSSNPVTSKGIKSALDTKADAAFTYTKEEVNNLIVPHDSNLVITADHTAISSPQTNTIYREYGETSYSDWAYTGNAWQKLATYNNIVDEEPVENSENLVKSGGIYPIKESLNETKIDVYGGTRTVEYAADDLTSRIAGLGYLTSENTITVGSHSSFTRWIIPNNNYKTIKVNVIYKGGASSYGTSRVLLYFHITDSFVFDDTKGYIQTDNDYIYYPEHAVSTAQHGSTYYWLSVNGSTEIEIPEGVDRIHVCTESPIDSTKPIIKLYKDITVTGLQESVRSINNYNEKQIAGNLTSLFSFTDMYAVSANTGNAVSSTVFSASNYVKIDDVLAIKIRLPRWNMASGMQSVYGIAFYDSSKVFISGVAMEKYKPSETVVSNGDTREYIVEVPSGAVFMRTTYFASSSSFYDDNFYCYNYSSIQEQLEDKDIQIEDYETDLSDVAFTDGKAISTSGYTIADSQQFALSDYLNIKGATNIAVTIPKYTTSQDKLTGYGLVFYDKNKVPFSGYNIPLYEDDDIHVILVTITVPRDAYYLRTTYFSKSSEYYEPFVLKADGLKTAITYLNNAIKILNEKEKAKEDVIKTEYRIIGSPSIYRSGSTGTASISLNYTDLCSLYDTLVDEHSDIFTRKEDFGIGTGDYELRRYSIAFTPKVFNASSENIWDETLMGRRRIVIVGGVHGDEDASIYGVYLSVKEILESNDEWATFIKSNFIVDVCPCINPWGLNNNKRQNANNVDINRDFDNLSQPETQAFATLLQSLPNLHAVIDNHNTVARYGYLVSGSSYKRKYLYSMISAQLAAALKSNLEILYNNTSLYPYEGQQITDEIGQTHWYVNNILDLPCITSEVPRGDNGTLTNTLKYVEQTKDICINLIMMLGC